MASKVLSVLLTVVLTLFTAEGCDKYDVPAGSSGGDSAGNNQPPAACQIGEVQMVPIVAPEVYNYAIFVEIEDGDCGNMNFKDKMSIERDGTYGHPLKHMVFDDGKSGLVNKPSPYQTGVVIEKSIPHRLVVQASVPVTPAMLNAGAAWLTCRIERNALLAPPKLGNVPLARVALTGTGIHTVQCRVIT